MIDTFLKPTLKRIEDLIANGTDEGGKVLSNRRMTHDFVDDSATLVEDDDDDYASEFKLIMKLISIIQNSGHYIDEETNAVKLIKSIPAAPASNPNDPRRQVARQL